LILVNVMYDIDGTDSVVPIEASTSTNKLCPISTMQHYKEAYLRNFGKKHKSKKLYWVKSDSSALKSQDITKIVSEIITFAVRTEFCSGHSFSIGGATAAAKAGLSSAKSKP
jgi:hypothetical protein